MIPSNGVTISAMTIRGVAQLAPWNYPLRYSQINNLVFLHLPSFNVTSDGPGDPSINIILSSNVPLALRPLGWTQQSAINVVDSSALEDAVYAITIFGATVTLEVPAGRNLTTGWGLNDTTICYQV
jgi:hypothetical protein